MVLILLRVHRCPTSKSSALGAGRCLTGTARRQFTDELKRGAVAIEPDCPRAHIAPSSRSRASDCDAAFPARSRLAGWVRERLWEFSLQPRVPLPRMPARTMIGIVPVTSTWHAGRLERRLLTVERPPVRAHPRSAENRHPGGGRRGLSTRREDQRALPTGEGA